MTVLLQGWRTHSLESIQKLQTQVHDCTACNHNAIPHAVWSGDSCRFLRGSHSLSQPTFKLRLASHTSHSLFTTFFSSGKENNSPQLNQLRTLFFFLQDISNCFMDHSAQTIRVYCFQHPLTAVVSFQGTFPLPSVLLLQLSAHLFPIFGVSKSSYGNKRGFLTDYFI